RRTARTELRAEKGTYYFTYCGHVEILRVGGNGNGGFGSGSRRLLERTPYWVVGFRCGVVASAGTGVLSHGSVLPGDVDVVGVWIATCVGCGREISCSCVNSSVVDHILEVDGVTEEPSESRIRLRGSCRKHDVDCMDDAARIGIVIRRFRLVGRIPK